jgi:hypothetical protein
LPTDQPTNQPIAQLTKTLLRLAATTAGLGLGLRALLTELPLRALFWDASVWTPVATLLGFSWTEWVTSAAVDHGIEVLNDLFGWYLLVAGLLTVVVQASNRWLRWLLRGAFVVLVFHHFLLWKEHFWQLGQLLELSLLTTSPLLYLHYTRPTPEGGPEETSDSSANFRLLRLLIALTFTGHGLYAVGFHAVPGNFVLMVQAGIGVGEEAARSLLLVVGVLDFVAAGLLLLPNDRARRVALWWIIPWALLTTFARLWSYGGLVSFDTLMTQWLPEVVVRLPHVMLPLAVWYGLARRRQPQGE